MTPRPRTAEEDAWLVALKSKSIGGHRILVIRTDEGWNLQPRCDWHEGRAPSVCGKKGDEVDEVATCFECLEHDRKGTSLKGP